MTEQEREELIEKMALRMLYQDSCLKYFANAKFLHEHKEWLDVARAALAVAEPAIREQCANDDALAAALTAFYGTPDEIKNETNRACMKRALLAAIREGGEDA